jgi:hypothetical protein
MGMDMFVALAILGPIAALVLLAVIDAIVSRR